MIIEQVAHVAVVRRRLAEIIETGPDKFAGHEWKLILALEFPVRRRRPGRRVKVVGTHLEIRLALGLVGADGEKIFAARTDARGRLAAENRQARIGLVRPAIFASVCSCSRKRPRSSGIR